MSTILDERTPKARKWHRCDSCGKFIEPGETHHVQISVVDGEFNSYRAHADCNEAERIVYHFTNGDWGMTAICDMEEEDRAIVREENPELAKRIWGDA